MTQHGVLGPPGKTRASLMAARGGTDAACMAPSQREFASRVIDSLSSGVVGIDADGVVRLFNEGARRVLAPSLRAGAQALGCPAREVLAHEPQLLSMLLGALSGRSSVSRAELSLAGGPGTVGLTLNAVRDASAAVCGAVLLLRDLRALERAGEHERLQERLAALGQMAAGMAHEIRNPLAGMEVIAGLLRRRLRGEDRELALELSEQIQSVADTVNDSLDFVRPVEPRAVPVDVGALLEAALQQGTARSRIPLTVERDLASPLPPLVGDPALLTTALANLVGNACDGMAAGPHPAHLALRVRCGPLALQDVRGSGAAAPAGEVVISIEDSGPGIPPEDRERIFYPFYTTKQNGSGIGLPQAQKIAMAHGGCISVDSAPGQGAIFRVHLPGPGFFADRVEPV